MLADASALTTAELCALVARVAAMPEAADAADGVERIRQCENLKNALAAVQQREAVALAEQRRVEDAAAGVPAARCGRGAAGEIGLARRVSPAQARRWLGLARILRTELPHTFAAVREGRVSEWRAGLVAAETIFLSREHRAVVDTELASRLEMLGDRAVAAQARRIAYRLDPAGATARAGHAERDRRVGVRPAADTMCWLSALLPVAQGVAAYAALKREADTVVGEGRQGTHPDGRPLAVGQVMADTLVTRLTGHAVADAVPVEISLVMTDHTLFGHTTVDEDTDADAGQNEPGIIPGYGPVPAPVARTLALSDTGAQRWIRRLYLTPDRRRIVDLDTRRRTFTPTPRAFLRARDHDTCRTPWCDAPARHLDHVNDWANTHISTVTAAQQYCQACNHTKQAPGWHTTATDDTTVTTHTPTGHHYPSHTPAPPGAPPPRPPDTTPNPAGRPRPLIQVIWEPHAA